MNFIIILRIIFNLIFLIMCNIFYNFINEISESKKCPYNKGWKITYGKYLTIIFILISAINVILPFNKFIFNIPLISTLYIIAFFALTCLMLFIINNISHNIIEHNKCKFKNYNFLIQFNENKTFSDCLFLTIIITIILFCF